MKLRTAVISLACVSILFGAGCSPLSAPKFATDLPEKIFGTKVQIKDMQFSPAAVTIKKGDTITWKNEDSQDHTITGENGGPSSEKLTLGQSYSYAFKIPGTFTYHCSLHPSMVGTVTVTE